MESRLRPMSDEKPSAAPAASRPASSKRPEPFPNRPPWWVIIATVVLTLAAVSFVAWWVRGDQRRILEGEALRQQMEQQTERWKELGSLEPSGGKFFFHRVEIPVPQYLQGDPRWAEDTLGPTPASLAAEGCALTSAAMVLTFYGVDTDPKRLNDFLKGNEGFTPEGWIWWEKAAEFPPVKVRKAYEDPASYWLIDQNLEAGNPVIVKLKMKRTNHFVVIVGKQGFDYLTRDPGQGGMRGVYPLKELGSKIEGLRYYERLPGA